MPRPGPPEPGKASGAAASQVLRWAGLLGRREGLHLPGECAVTGVGGKLVKIWAEVSCPWGLTVAHSRRHCHARSSVPPLGEEKGPRTAHDEPGASALVCVSPACSGPVMSPLPLPEPGTRSTRPGEGGTAPWSGGPTPMGRRSTSRSRCRAGLLSEAQTLGKFQKPRGHPLGRTVP